MAYKRFIDRKDTHELIDNFPEFKLRKHGMPDKRVLMYIMVIPVTVICSMIFLAVKKLLLDQNTTPLDEAQGYLIIIGVLITLIAWFCYKLIRKTRDIITHTEFHNLLFAGSIVAISKFCAIVSNKKSIIYADNNFSRIFPPTETDSDNLDDIFANNNISKDVEEQIQKAITDGKEMIFPFDVEGANGSVLKTIVEIKPLSRPYGFSIIRGYTKE